MKTTILLASCYIMFFVVPASAQVGINTSTPDAASMLDVSSTDKGLLIPRVDITDLNTIEPITGGSTESLLVYNTNTTTGKGFHYWDGTQWIPIIGDDWQKKGNLSTVPGTAAGQNFIGTADNQDLVVATNGTERFRVENTGEIRLNANGSEGNPVLSWLNDPDTGIWRLSSDQFVFSTGGRERLYLSNSLTEFNFPGVNVDFRVKSDNDNNALYVDGGNNNTGIGTGSPNSSAKLEINSNDKGVLIPRVNISNLSTLAPVTGAGAESLLVYNTNTTTGKGFHYWSGSQWIPLSSDDWKQRGNLGTVPGTGAGQNYIGTADNQDLVIATNGAERFRVENTGELRLNTNGTEGSPLLSWGYDTDTGFYRWGANSLGFSTGGTQRLFMDNWTTGFNSPGSDINFFVRTDNDNNALYVDGGNNNTGIGTGSPDSSAKLEINSSDKGLLIPRVNVTDLNTIAPITGGSTESLLVYNTNTTTGKGFHYWSGSQWIPLSSDDWKQKGNLGTVPGTAAGQNFIGTADNQDLVIATNGTERLRVENTGELRANTNGSSNSPVFSWGYDTDTGLYRSGANSLSFSTGGTERLVFDNWNAVLNDPSSDVNFIVRTDNHASTLFVDGGNDNVGLGTLSPNPSAMLDINSSNKGLLVPRVNISNLSTLAPVTGSGAESLLVYNTNTTTGKGFHYWNGSQWVPLAGSGGGGDPDWTINGNSNITTSNFFGTTNNNDIRIRTNNTEKVRITTRGQIETYNTGRSVFVGENTGENSALNNTLESVFVGYNSGRTNTVGLRNTGVGAYALEDLAHGIENASLGQGALRNVDMGNGNVGIGFNAGSVLTNGSDNVAIGRNAGPNANWIGHSVSIGTSSTTTGWGQIRLGNGSVSSIGGYANWSNLSDGRFKYNVAQNVPGLAFIDKLNPVTYQVNYNKLNHFLGVDLPKEYAPYVKEKEQKTQTGFIAQEVEQTAKELGYEFSGIEVPQNSNSHYALRYGEFVVPLVKAVQELKDMVDQQREEINKLKDLIAIMNAEEAQSNHPQRKF